ncbi:DUF6803 family protein [Paracraurococcus lichenis]|uniref:Permease n=1 Tax=Paracraurococcus lichenis TaxID=3064888 RepID=A0ABT9ECP8_9PROT|nr:DUF6803 family protein [Paracraurococcus sp. LOR1-02]MDO9713810.1 permease [Paracraurococcus sp. LOR1-02]
MTMTHYMELLATNQPWNLLLFMAVPVILAETLAITELAVLFRHDAVGPVRTVNRWSAILAGGYFAIVFATLMVTAAIPLTLAGGWRGPIDVIAVGFYLFGIVPLGGVALLELGIIGRDRSEHERMKLHVAFVALFLLTAHVAMIAGMLDPTLIAGDAMAADQGPHPTH